MRVGRSVEGWGKGHYNLLRLDLNHFKAQMYYFANYIIYRKGLFYKYIINLPYSKICRFIR